MWVRIDDKLPRHPKILAAGEIIGTNGAGLALAVYVAADCYCAEHLTDGLIAPEAIRALTVLVRKPYQIAEALVTVKLFERDGNNYRIHDYHDYNPSATEVKDKRARDRARKAIPGDSTPTPAGNGSGSAPIPNASRAGADARPQDGTGSYTGSGSGISEKEKPPIVRASAVTGSGVMAGMLPRDHLRHAFCGRVCLPERLHVDFLRAIGGDPETGAERVRAFCEAVEATWSNGGPQAATAIGDDAFAFWRARWAEQHGSTVKTHRKPTLDEQNAAAWAEVDAVHAARVAKGGA